MTKETAALSLLLTQAIPDQRPGFVPSTATERASEGEHGVHILTSPMHAAAFEANLDDELVGTFHDPAANRIAGGLELRVGDLGAAFFEIAEHPVTNRTRFLRANWQSAHRRKHPIWVAMFKLMQPVSQPVARLRRAGAEGDLSGTGKMLRRMREVENTDGVKSVAINKALLPLRSIHNCANLSCRFDPPTVELRERRRSELRRITQPREVREPDGVGHLTATCALPPLYGAHGKGFHFRPDPTHQGHHRAIHAHLLDLRSCRGCRALTPKLLRFCRLPLDQHFPSTLGEGPGGLHPDFHPGEFGQGLTHLFKGDQRTEPHDPLPQLWGVGPWPQFEFLIQGEKAPRCTRGTPDSPDASSPVDCPES